MATIYDEYKAVIGLEVHAQLLNESKQFSSEHYEYGSEPNTQVSPISLGHPGTLPKPNQGALENAIRLGLATQSTINKETHFARKNYFYPDLPKGYQITEYTTPLCTDGHLVIQDPDGHDKSVGIEKIIMEEDSGKSIHDLDPFYSLVDLNRAGVPLLETVSKPDINYPEEAYNYLVEIRKIVRYLGICDGNMEEGSLRCDVNISVMKKDASLYGTKVEIKNLNSFRNVQKALDYEFKRQVDLLEKGEQVDQATLGFDPVEGQTFEMRTKEMAEDYRYFPEPDIPPFALSDEYLDSLKATLPMLPRERQHYYEQQWGLKPEDANLLASEKPFSEYFEAIVAEKPDYKAAANWMIGPIRSYLNENAVRMEDFSLSSIRVAQIIQLIEDGKLNFSTASNTLFDELIKQPEKDPETLANELNLIQVGDDDFLMELVSGVIQENPQKVEEYRNGKTGLLSFFMGQVMKKSQGKADPKKTNQLLEQELNKAEA